MEEASQRLISVDEIYDALKEAEGKGYWDKVIYSVDIGKFKYSVSYTDRNELTGDSLFPDGCAGVLCRPLGTSKDRNNCIGDWVPLDYGSRVDLAQYLFDIIEESAEDEE